MSKGDLYRAQAECIGEGENAIRVEVDGVRAWIPRSQIHEDSEVYELGHVGELVIPEWLATDRDLP